MNNDLRERLFNFKGIGNPKSKYWFVGFEDEMPCERVKDLDFLKNDQDYTFYEPNWYSNEIMRLHNHFPKKRFTPTFDIMAQIILRFESEIDVRIDKFIDSNLLIENGYGFLMNLFPIGKVRKTDKLSSNILMDLDFTGTRSYYNVVRESRIPRLRAFRIEQKPEFTICYTTNRWDEYENLFDLNSDNSVTEGEFRIYKNERIIMTPTFTMKNITMQHIIKMVEIMKSW